MEKFTLINEAISMIEVFETFEDSSKQPSMINSVLISCSCFFRDKVSQLWNALGCIYGNSKKI